MLNISVIIPNYNYGRYLRQAIDSALGQTLPPHEVIVVDDGSTDNTDEILADYQDRIKVARQQNQGVATARNKGAGIATGDLLGFLDSDDVWLPTKLELQVKRFLAEPDLGLVHCGVLNIDSDGVPLEKRVDGMEGWVALEMLRFRKSVVIAPGSASLIPRSVFEEVGGYDTDRRLHPSEDWDLSYRIACSHKIGFVPEVLIHYRQHGKNDHLNIRAMEQAMMLAYAKAFARANFQLRRIQRECYGNLHMVLAGCYYTNTQPYDFVRNLLKGLWLAPATVSRPLGFPLRRLRRSRLLGKMSNLFGRSTSNTP